MSRNADGAWCTRFAKFLYWYKATTTCFHSYYSGFATCLYILNYVGGFNNLVSVLNNLRFYKVMHTFVRNITNNLHKILTIFGNYDIINNHLYCNNTHLGLKYRRLTLSTLSNFNGLFHSFFWIKLKRSVVLKGLSKDIQKVFKNQPMFFLLSKRTHLKVDLLHYLCKTYIHSYI